MSVLILYFAALRELLGKGEERLAGLPGTLTVGELAVRLGELYPRLVPHLGSVRFALNESFVELSAEVADGDTVALIPPVSGG